MRKPARPINYTLFAASHVVSRLAELSGGYALTKTVPSARFMDAFFTCDASVVGRDDRFSVTHAAFFAWCGFEGEKLLEQLHLSWVWYGFGELVRILYDRLCEAEQRFPFENPYAEIVEGIAHEMDRRLQFHRR